MLEIMSFYFRHTIKKATSTLQYTWYTFLASGNANTHYTVTRFFALYSLLTYLLTNHSLVLTVVSVGRLSVRSWRL